VKYSFFALTSDTLALQQLLASRATTGKVLDTGSCMLPELCARHCLVLSYVAEPGVQEF